MSSDALSGGNSDVLAIARRATMLSIVHVRKPQADLLRALSEAFHCTWPVIPNTSASHGEILWMSPQEWAVDGIVPALVKARVLEACADTLCDVADMSAAFASFDISGSESQGFLAKSCSLDFHSRAFGGGVCARSLFAQVSALISRPGEERHFRLYVDASLARYIEDWLTDAAAEYRVRAPSK